VDQRLALACRTDFSFAKFVEVIVRRLIGYQGVVGTACFIWLVTVFAATGDAVDFAREIVPIFEQHCIRCHHPENKQGDLSLATFGDLETQSYVTPGEPDESYLLEVVTAVDGRPPAMPKEGEPLSADQVDRLRRWIADGAKWPDGLEIRETAKADSSWWSLQPLAIEPPEPANLPDAMGRQSDRPVRLSASWPNRA
jgi:hypothetical protein